MRAFIDDTNPNSSIISSPSFLSLPNFNLTYRMRAKVFRQKGDLKYEYNPFRNMFSSGTKEIINGNEVVTDVGKLTDFRVKDLGFNLNHPVEMTIQPSYDGTANVILNDNLNPPRLINSRFTPTEDMRYEIIDRSGNNDTNVYKEEFLNQNTRLFKTSENIPYITYDGLYEGGHLEVGSYTYYLKYVDADGNESDIIAESGLISCHVGKLSDPFSMHGGVLNESSNKLIKLTVNNLDPSYDYVNVYYSRSTGEYSKEPMTSYYRLKNKKSITNSKLELILTGLEQHEEVSIDQLNIQYNIVDKVKTHAQIQNMLFLGNVSKPTIAYKELEDLALRVYPTLSNDKNIGKLTHEYEPIILNDDLDRYEYYDTQNVYKFTGYWDKEIYRVGIVFIMLDDTLSPVFNTRGKNNLNSGPYNAQYTMRPLHENNVRSYIESDEEGFILNSSIDLENSKGTFRVNYDKTLIGPEGIFPIGIDFTIPNDVLREIKNYAKGFFFVRQRRIPTILMQGLSIGVDAVSDLPVLRAKINNVAGDQVETYFTESFLNKSAELVHDFSSRVIQTDNAVVGGLLSPEANLKSNTYNGIFTGTEFNVSPSIISPINNYFKQDVINERHFYIEDYTTTPYKNSITNNVKLTLLEDNQPLRYSGTKRFSSRAGIPEESWRVAFFGIEDKAESATSLVRGSYTGYIGMENFNQATTIVDIHIPGYNMNNMRDYFKVRFGSTDSFYSISDRYDLRLLEEGHNYPTLKTQSNRLIFTEYRGDCYINTVTMRIQRNFQDPDVPISDDIIDNLSWKNNYKGFTVAGAIDDENLLKINRNDVNAIQIGHWATFKIMSNVNLSLRSVDESNDAEYALTGNPRSFHPLASMSVSGESKIPESNLYNAGFNRSVNERLYYSTPEVPYIKNIFDTRVMYSDIHISDAFRNGYRIFQGLSYKDLTKQYGAITKILNIADNLLVVFERGIGMYVINREALFAGGETGEVFTKGVGVLSEKPQRVISDSFGSSWKDSVIRTENWIYGVDTVSKKIWRTNGEDFEMISDFRIQHFLNTNITLSEDDKTPMMGLRNVKTHYNNYKKDVIFTFYDLIGDRTNSWSIAYNELQKVFVTRYSWLPASSENVSNVLFTFDQQSTKHLALPGYTNYNNAEALGITLDGKREEFTKNGVSRVIEKGINIISLSNHVIGTLKMKGYDYYNKYDLTYSLTSKPDNQYFSITGNSLRWKNNTAFPKYSFELELKVELSSSGQVIESWTDTLGVKVARDYIWQNMSDEELELYDTEFSTWFWKHGQAGLFDITTPILPTMWYDKQEPFEYEYIVVDSPDTHKILDNLVIISNDVGPDSFQFTVTEDVYASLDQFKAVYTNFNNTRNTVIGTDNVSTYQKAIDIRREGIRHGNMSYKESVWNVVVKPHQFEVKATDEIKTSKIRDKYFRIRIRYTGDKLAIITAIHTMFTQSFS